MPHAQSRKQTQKAPRGLRQHQRLPSPQQDPVYERLTLSCELYLFLFVFSIVHSIQFGPRIKPTVFSNEFDI
jgi:hypothetical protein